jgi:hypothetical protein
MPYLTIEYDKDLEVTRVVFDDGRIVTTGLPLRDNPIGPGTVDGVTVSEIIEWKDDKGVRMICLHHRCRKYC